MTCGTAHIDVDDVGATVSRDLGAFRHPARLTAGELYDVGTDTGRLAAQLRSAQPLSEVLARSHFGDNQPRAELRGHAAERCIGDPGHRRKQHPIGNADITNGERCRLQWCETRD